eukprot:123115-Pelagomonas_calceolata.AAC.3
MHERGSSIYKAGAVQGALRPPNWVNLGSIKITAYVNQERVRSVFNSSIPGLGRAQEPAKGAHKAKYREGASPMVAEVASAQHTHHDLLVA